MPGELEHSSGEVDEFEAALVAARAADRRRLRGRRRGGGAEAAAGVGDADEDGSSTRSSRSRRRSGRPSAARWPCDGEGEEVEGVYEDELSDADDATLEEEAVAAAPASSAAKWPPRGAPGAPTRRGPARFIGFLRASWAELQRVQWPDRRQVAQATAVVIGFVVVAGLYLGVADWVAKKIVDFII